tara:strand:- start:87 stop:416 length:330 start_codon:yes stop_codon:yes gene_type:complete
MSHFSKVVDGLVTEVIKSEKDFINSGFVGDEFKWIQTSYTASFRGSYSAIGDAWDSVNQVFIKPKPYPSWTLDSNYEWQSPVARPALALGVISHWDEDSGNWVERTAPI